MGSPANGGFQETDTETGRKLLQAMLGGSNQPAMNLPLNFSAPTGQVQNTYAASERTNQYLTPSQYEGMQLHTPSGYYYQGGKMYQPYTPEPVTYNPYQNVFNWNKGFSWENPSNQSNNVANSVKIGNQYFKPFTGNAQGIINGDLSMVSMLNQQPTSQPQGVPSNLLNFLSSQNMQPTNNQQSSGAGRFLSSSNTSQGK